MFDQVQTYEALSEPSQTFFFKFFFSIEAGSRNTK